MVFAQPWLVALLVARVSALPQVRVVSTSLTAASATTTATPAAVATAIPSPVAPLSATLPSQAPLAPKQAWCPSEIFCAGQLLQTLNIAQPFNDSKTIVDKPTVKSASATLTDFQALGANGSVTISSIVNFIEQDFKGEGQELKPVTVSGTSTPSFLNSSTDVPDTLVRAWGGIVDSYWENLIRETDRSTLCPNSGDGCTSSLIPLNHTFVVPGGRFREQYYWDSFWILEGLLASGLYDIAKSTLLNFMDELRQFGFIPNGGRIYYLNRSQPPVFIHMLHRYVNVTSDKSILADALPLAEKELQWWATNRTLTVTSPYTQKVYNVSRYAVVNTAPRPESYLEDYETANGAGLNWTDDQKAAIYAELASGAETGWDYCTRWTKFPFATLANTTDQEPLLRGLNIRALIPVDLNSILYNSEIFLSELYDQSGSGSKSKRNGTPAASHRASAAKRKEAILDLMWDSQRLGFYDFNTTSNSRTDFLTAAHFYPFWNGIWPKDLLEDEAKMQGAFASVGLLLAQYNGTLPSTFINSGAQWDAPNAWPPHQYIAMQAIANIPKNVSTKPYPELSSSLTSWSLVPQNQLGLDQSQLPVQTLALGGNASGDINYAAGTWANGGAVPSGKTETWSEALLRGLVNRYISSVFCSWYSTGGSIPGLLNQLSPQELNATHSDPSSKGHMYEKFNMFDVDAAGSGGEYTVQDGFGWTNGVALWIIQNYGKVLAKPSCPAIILAPAAAPAAKRDIVYRGERVKRSDGKYLVELTRAV
ncbi:hypothetical protein FRB99_007577 [Tulasnella sp. 403]|nr:hypothetical protein FRB99_007577 [Tulasnella sp. 403]